MLLIGLTGSIATGKSTVSSLLRSEPYNLPIIDADVLARQVVEPGTYGYKRVIAAFGESTPDLLLPTSSPSTQKAGLDDGAKTEETRGRRTGQPINRAALGRRVFGSSPSRMRDRKTLNGIIHPLVRLAMLRHVLYYYLTGHWAVVLDIPLLFESGLDIFCGVVIMVAVSDPIVQMRRLRERDKGLSAEEAEGRVGSQMAVGEKVAATQEKGERRGKVILNDRGMEELRREVDRVIGEVKKEGGGPWWRIWFWGNPLAALVFGSQEVLKSWWARRRQQSSKNEKARL
ncbi:uncharacterized protein KY384_005375 [Bacidia gigantensis]|uniref:uncharacterized protein n=1 Tax=Bacidia gigantensis TaxID=2732470 RepID=UPI001D0457AC|nr:uncharacterized protein KY384_005375 [Bacidia gigantensis]KAG8529894.1 hypothetical protein KY384_005375 [Bacidia gigantensis]